MQFSRCSGGFPFRLSRRRGETLVGSSGLEPPCRLRRLLGAAINVSPFALIALGRFGSPALAAFPFRFSRRRGETLVGSSGLEPPCRLRRLLGAAINVSPFAPLNDPPDRFVPAAPALTSRLSRSVGSALLPWRLSLFVSPAAAEKPWWAQVDSNHRPRAYQARALTS